MQRTGWGKSFVYFIATRLLRDAGAGPTLLISPLLALMRNQIATAEAAGVRAHTINRSNREAHEAVEQAVHDDAVDLLLISPERLNNPKFRSEVLASIAARTGLLVIDEAHCISDWGHDFRPDYRRVVSVLSLLAAGVPVLATTATANDRVVDDVTSQLGIDLRIQRGSLDRESLSLHVLQGLRTQPQRYAWLGRYLADLEGTGIIYCLTIRDANRLAAWLEHKGFAVASYSGATDPEARLEIERRFMDNQLKAIVATSALGMGYDKADVGFVIHFQMPGSTVAYYQQVGRAGRSLARAHGILMCGQEDRDIQDYFVQSAFPPEALARAVVSYLGEDGEPRSTNDILARVNIR
ncbi:MAG: RecQ family ATP-dependent DNA helicase, partial [Actinomycetota bacterium]